MNILVHFILYVISIFVAREIILFIIKRFNDQIEIGSKDWIYCFFPIVNIIFPIILITLFYLLELRQSMNESIQKKKYKLKPFWEWFTYSKKIERIKREPEENPFYND